MVYALIPLKRAIKIGTVITALLLSGVGPFAVGSAQAAQLQQRTLQLNDSRPGVIAEYRMAFSIPSTATLGSIKVDFCGNLALLYFPCTPPPGLDVSGAIVVSQTGVSGFSVDASTTSNSLILTRTPAAIPAGDISITLGGVVNPSTADVSFFARYYTYATADASGPVTDDGAVASIINDDYSISTEVPPYLDLCVGATIPNANCTVVEGSFVQLGQLSVARPAAGQSRFAIATNADSGYAVYIQGRSMTSGNNVIAAMANPGSSNPGANQFGINLRDNGNPDTGADPDGPGSGSPAAAYGQSNIFKYSSGDIIASKNSVEDYRRYTVTYLINISSQQPPGVYSSSFTYIALGNF